MSTTHDSTARPPCFEAVDDRMAAVLAAKSGAERVAIAFGLYRSTWRMLESHLRAKHPEWTREEVARETALRISHGTG